MTREISPITKLRRKRAGGLELTDDERTILRIEDARYDQCRVTIHLKRYRRDAWMPMAKQSNQSFSSWIQIMVERGLMGAGEAVKDLQHENQRLRDEATGLRAAHGQLAVDNANLHARIEALEGSLQEAMQHALRLAGEAQ